MGRPRRPWIKVLIDIVDSDKLHALPSDVARWGWIRVLVEAKTQRKMGIFGSRQHLRNILGQHGRFVGEYIKVELAHEVPTDAPIGCVTCRKWYPEARKGEVVIHDFRREQIDPTKTERGGEAEENPPNPRDNGEIPPRKTAADSRARGTTVTVTGISLRRESPSARDRASGAPDEPPDVQALLDRGWPAVTEAQRDVLFELADRHDQRGHEGEWAAEVIRAAPLDEDPLRALLDLDREWKANRRAEIDRQELEWKATKEAQRRALDNAYRPPVSSSPASKEARNDHQGTPRQGRGIGQGPGKSERAIAAELGVSRTTVWVDKQINAGDPRYVGAKS